MKTVTTELQEIEKCMYFKTVAHCYSLLLSSFNLRRFRGAHGLSGYGLELTFRLKKEPGQGMPPSWPAELMQELAKYVFRTSKRLAKLHANQRFENSSTVLIPQGPLLETSKSIFLLIGSLTIYIININLMRLSRQQFTNW